MCELHFESFSLYFLQSLSSEEISSLPAPDSPSAYERMGRSWAPVLELTHNHGTESDAAFSYHDGNTEPKVRMAIALANCWRPSFGFLDSAQNWEGIVCAVCDHGLVSGECTIGKT